MDYIWVTSAYQQFFYSNFFYINFTIYGKSTNNSKSNGEINSPDVPSRIGPIKN